MGPESNDPSMGSRNAKWRVPESVEKTMDLGVGDLKEVILEGEGIEESRERLGVGESGFGVEREWSSMEEEESAAASAVAVAATAMRREKGEIGERKRRESMDFDWGNWWKLGFDIFRVLGD